ncbi:hypothetical protein CCACVL1_28012 [Corchorus capsularis]|uniref:Uncharacterized protein n=1 Tax=Corchorus capsularis TaxID=210143 RepID=A0A1R3G7S7_COCAP|nr:hypothetical protein CCACVL1_28012 [Corchorus capsularis]
MEVGQTIAKTQEECLEDCFACPAANLRRPHN